MCHFNQNKTSNTLLSVKINEPLDIITLLLYHEGYKFNANIFWRSEQLRSWESKFNVIQKTKQVLRNIIAWKNDLFESLRWKHSQLIHYIIHINCIEYYMKEIKKHKSKQYLIVNKWFCIWELNPILYKIIFDRIHFFLRIMFNRVFIQIKCYYTYSKRIDLPVFVIDEALKDRSDVLPNIFLVSVIVLFSGDCCVIVAILARLLHNTFLFTPDDAWNNLIWFVVLARIVSSEFWRTLLKISINYRTVYVLIMLNQCYCK